MSYNEVIYWNNRINPNQDTLPPPLWTDYVFKSIRGCQSLLDFGPGVGRFFPVYKGFKSVDCFDITDRHLSELMSFSKLLGFKLNFISGLDVGVTPYYDDQFEVVVCVQVLLHQRDENIEKVMSELARIGRKVAVISYRTEIPFDLAEHVFNHDYLSICKKNNWWVREVVQTDKHILFNYGR